MESNGAAGKIQVSGTTAALLQQAGVHTLEYRGKIAAKGKGELDTYWLLNRHSGLPFRVVAVPDRRSSGFGSSLLGRRQSAQPSNRTSRGSSIAGMAEALAGVTVEGAPSREGSLRAGSDAPGGYAADSPPPLRRAVTAPNGSTQLTLTPTVTEEAS